ncbi:MAG: hypothetical protein AAF420_12410 [Pseudomonadota bacterium]
MQPQAKRLYLLRIVKIMTLIIVFTSFFVLFSNFFRSQEVRQTFAIPIEEVKAALQVSTTWGQQPILVVWRSPLSLSKLTDGTGLRDPLSEQAQQPEFARNPWRSRRPEVFVLVPLGTAIGCPIEPMFQAGDLLGFRDRCRGWRYDAAGRVLENQEALRNLRVPDYVIVDGQLRFGDE